MNYGIEILSVYSNTCVSLAAPNKNCFYLFWKEIAIVLDVFVSKVFHYFIYGMIIRDSENPQIQLAPVEAVGIQLKNMFLITMVPLLW